ncbi:MAG TPA: 50S ribosomal protein L25 [Clostridiales bacterium]|jgi:large subunit ribosomal protein L25|nr:50S ribosomal protein L25 [Clostridiales bacterium]HCS09947.1 50S ribosomal protein L25 [Clostridiales bacterium]
MSVGALSVEKRVKTNSRTSKQLRREGYLPGSISSKGKDSVSVTIKADELRKGLSTYGRNALFKITLEDKELTGMVKDIQLSPVKGSMLHVDFQEVSLTEEIKVVLSIAVKGIEALEFKELMALRQTDAITVKGLPQDIPDDIVIDVSKIDKVQNVCLKDVKFPEGIVPEGDPEHVLISIVEAKRTAVEEEEETAEDTDTEVEVIGEETEEE